LLDELEETQALNQAYRDRIRQKLGLSQ
jgi:hypothetical protein